MASLLDEYDSIKKGPATPNKPPPPDTPQQAWERGKNAYIENQPFAAGMGQGVANYGETPFYYLEKGIRQFNPDFRMPGHALAADIRNRVQSTQTGRIGEDVGGMLPAFLPMGWLGEIATSLPWLARAAKLYEEMNPVIRGSVTGAAQGLLANPAKNMEEAETQAVTGGLFGAAGGKAFSRVGSKAASREGTKAMEKFVKEGEEPAFAKYVGGGGPFNPRFEPMETAEPKTYKDTIRQANATAKEQARAAKEAEKAEGKTPGKGARRFATNAAWLAAHAFVPPGGKYIAGHAGSAAIQSVLDRMSEGDIRQFSELIDAYLARRGHQATFTSRAGALGGVAGRHADTLNEPYPIPSLISGQQ